VISRSPLGLVGGLPLVLAVALAAGRSATKDTTNVEAEIRITRADTVLGAVANPQRLRVRVEARVDYDSLGRLYYYVYTVYNDATSDSTLDTFALRPIPAGSRIESPKDWTASCCSWEGVPSAVAWTVIGREGEFAPVGFAERAPMARSVANPRPGEAVSGFRLVTRAPPANIRFYAEQFDTLRAGEGDALTPTTIFDHGVQGTIVGPDTTRGAASSRRAPARLDLHYTSESGMPSGEAWITYTVARAQEVQIEICGPDGRPIRTIRRGPARPGAAGATWNGLDGEGKAVAAGPYTWRLSGRTGALEARPIRVP
jgi:hypothetical protein